MSAPLGLDIKSNINEMTVGCCIPCRYTALTSGTPGNFSELGTFTASEIPITGSAIPDGTFYFNMIESTLLIADRVVQTNVSWNALNNVKFIEGKVIILNNIEYLIRSLSGGCAYADENGNMSLTDKGLGAWHINNEWDKYIVKSDLGGKITPGDDNVWHFNIWNWGKETPINGLITDTSSNNINTYRVTRGYAPDGILELDTGLTTFTSANGGFRPVLQLKHPKQTNLWY